MNTEFSYLYRDACNYKTFDEVVIAGEFSMEDIARYLADGELFIPSEIGLEDIQPCPLDEDDHVWHEVEYLKPTDAAPTVTMDAKTFIAACKAASQAGWNEYVVSQRLGLV